MVTNPAKFIKHNRKTGFACMGRRVHAVQTHTASFKYLSVQLIRLVTTDNFASVLSHIMIVEVTGYLMFE